MHPTILCIASYEKGGEFLREAQRLGCRVLFLTVEKLKDAAWPREVIGDFFWLPDFQDRNAVLDAVAWLARSHRIARIIPLDEFDLELAAALREHLRIPGLGETATRSFRDKLAMREKALAAGIRVPPFTGVFHDADVRAFAADVPAPWVLKPRTDAAAIGIRKIQDADRILPELDALGDRRSRFLLEAYVAGPVFHVDSIVADGRVVFAAASRYATPPFDVAHHGGLFCSTMVVRGSAEEHGLLAANDAVVRAMEPVRGALHTEFIRSDGDGEFVFLETAARVGGAHIADMVEAGTGVNLWREWARVEIASARGEPYRPPQPKDDYAAILVSLARQEWPDTSAFDDAEVVWRLRKRHHAGLIVASADAERVAHLLNDYVPRFRESFFASLPAPDKPTA